MSRAEGENMEPIMLTAQKGSAEIVDQNLQLIKIAKTAIEEKIPAVGSYVCVCGVNINHAVIYKVDRHFVYLAIATRETLEDYTGEVYTVAKVAGANDSTFCRHDCTFHGRSNASNDEFEEWLYYYNKAL